MATINYWGLSKKGTVTVDLDNDTVDDLITAMAADESLPTEYYSVSILQAPEYNDTVYGDSTTTLGGSGLGLSDGDTVLCTPRQDGTKEQRQIQKLEIAAKARANDSNARDTYDISELPTKYSGNDVYDNLNEGGLVQGRPWATAETPDSISGLRFWLDTATTSTLNNGTYTDGAALTSWRERKAAPTFSIQAANRQPTIQSGAGDLLNGYPVVRFAYSIAGDWDQAEWLSVSGFANATGYTMILLAKLTSHVLASSLQLLRIRNGDGTYSSSIYYNTAAGRFELVAPTGFSTVDANVDPDSTWKIITVRYDSTAAAANRFTFRWAKTARTVTNSTTPSGALAATAGNNMMVGYFWDADWAEQLVYNTALSDAQIIALEDYLSSKWGV